MKRDELEQCLRGWKVRLRDSAHDVEEIQRRFYAVSYTHLTLPTTPYV